MDRHTQIIATLGPKTNTCEKILALHEAGANFFRLNFSHGTHEEHAKVYDNIHRVREENGLDIGVIADLQGPKNRLGDFEKGKIEIKPGDKIRFDKNTAILGDENRISVNPPEIIDAMTAGQRFLINDGNVEMKVEETGVGFFEASVTYGTELSSRKGVNTPDVSLPISALTTKDREDLDFALGLGVDWIALSFTQKREDALEAKELIGNRAQLIAKIETPSGIRNYAEILDCSDAIMIARGDLGVELPFAVVPIVQKYMIDAARASQKPAIVATHMMESMTNAPRSTRAETGDVSTAVAQYASAVMTSGETATGEYPVETIEAIVEIIEEREKYMEDPGAYMNKLFTNPELDIDLSHPLPHPLLTWEDKRKRGEDVLTHLSMSM